MTIAGSPARPKVSANTPGGDAGDGAARNAPVIVMTYANAGGRQLQQLLEAQPELACTTGTGVLAACDQAAVAWRQVDGQRAATLSSLASKSIRAMASQMIMVITVRSGHPRWCEMAAPERSAAETFLQLFPGTRFLCLHRACPDLISATLRASPWGVSGTAFAPYVAAYPGSTVAALAAWWAARAGELAGFERDHPRECLRVRYEDLIANPAAAGHAIRAFLGLGGDITRLPEAPGVPIQAPADAGAGLPVGQIPPGLRQQVNDLQTGLGYPPLESGRTEGPRV